MDSIINRPNFSPTYYLQNILISLYPEYLEKKIIRIEYWEEDRYGWRNIKTTEKEDRINKFLDYMMNEGKHRPILNAPLISINDNKMTILIKWGNTGANCKYVVSFEDKESLYLIP